MVERVEMPSALSSLLLALYPLQKALTGILESPPYKSS